MDNQLFQVLFSAYKEQGDGEACGRLIESAASVIRRIARSIKEPGWDSDELFQLGLIGAWKALERFDASRGVAFTIFAQYDIRREMHEAIRADFGRRGLKLPNHLREKYRFIVKTMKELTQEYGRAPTEQELIQRLTKNGFKNAEAHLRSFHIDWLLVYSLDMKPKQGKGPIQALRDMTDMVAETPESRMLHDERIRRAERLLAETRQFMATKLQKNNAARILVLRYGLEGGISFTVREVARQLGISSARVSQVEISAIQKLKKFWRLEGTERAKEALQVLREFAEQPMNTGHACAMAAE